VATTLGQHLVLDVRRRHARVDVQLGRARDVEDVAVAGVHVDDHRRDLEMARGDALVRVADGHGQLELAQRADGAPRPVRDLDAGVEVHVSRAQVANGKRVAAEVDRLEAVVHDELRAVRVVHARAEQVRL
jgi:hypothetical protein